MRRLMPLIAGIFALTLASPGAAQTQDPLKIGYINSQQIIQEAPGAQEAREELEADLSQYRSEVQQMGQELQEMIQQFEQQQATLTAEARQNRQDEIRQQQQEYQRRIQQLEQQAAQRQQELVQPIMQRINAVIEEIRRDGSYTMVFDVAAQGIIAADPGLDLTPEVIRRLQEQADTTSNGGAGSP